MSMNALIRKAAAADSHSDLAARAFAGRGRSEPVYGLEALEGMLARQRPGSSAYERTMIAIDQAKKERGDQS